VLLFSLVTPVYSLYFCIVLFTRFNKLNDDDDDNVLNYVRRTGFHTYLTTELFLTSLGRFYIAFYCKQQMGGDRGLMDPK